MAVPKVCGFIVKDANNNMVTHHILVDFPECLWTVSTHPWGAGTAGGHIVKVTGVKQLQQAGIKSIKRFLCLLTAVIKLDVVKQRVALPPKVSLHCGY